MTATSNQNAKCPSQLWRLSNLSSAFLLSLVMINHGCQALVSRSDFCITKLPCLINVRVSVFVFCYTVGVRLMGKSTCVCNPSLMVMARKRIYNYTHLAAEADLVPTHDRAERNKERGSMRQDKLTPPAGTTSSQDKLTRRADTTTACCAGLAPSGNHRGVDSDVHVRKCTHDC